MTGDRKARAVRVSGDPFQNADNGLPTSPQAIDPDGAQASPLNRLRVIIERDGLSPVTG